MEFAFYNIQKDIGSRILGCRKTERGVYVYEKIFHAR